MQQVELTEVRKRRAKRERNMVDGRIKKKRNVEEGKKNVR